jgi:hypothetical protein
LLSSSATEDESVVVGLASPGSNWHANAG